MSLGKRAVYRQFIKSLQTWALSLKKTLKASEQGREDIAKARKEWEELQKTVDIERFVFLDESGVKTNMTRLYGRAYGGLRCNDTTPCGNWNSTTVLSSMRLDGTTESIVFDGAVDRSMFDAYIEQVLAPTLRPGDILVMDNLSTHKSKLAQSIVKSRQAEILFLPAYSPDLNPIEKMWSKVKQLLRGMKPRTAEDLFSSVGTALGMVSASDDKGWFESCGYI